MLQTFTGYSFHLPLAAGRKQLLVSSRLLEKSELISGLICTLSCITMCAPRRAQM